MLRLFQTELTIACKDDEEVKAPLVTMYLASRHVKAVLTESDSDSNKEIRIDARTISAKAVGVVVKHLSNSSRRLSKCLSEIYYEDVVYKHPGPSRAPGSVDVIPTGAKKFEDVDILKEETIIEVVRFVDMFMIDELMDDLVEYTSLRPTLEHVAAIDAVRSDDASWATVRVLEATKSKLHRLCFYIEAI